MLSVLIPVKEPEPWLGKCLRQLDQIEKRNRFLISEVLQDVFGTLAEARKSLAQRARCPYICNLDADTILPLDYLEQALKLIQSNPKIGAVAINYRPRSQYHLAFGTSVMQRRVFLEQYDFKDITRNPPCECMYMWHKLHDAGYIIATLPFTATHKDKGRCIET